MADPAFPVASKTGPETALGRGGGASFGYKITHLPDGNFLATWLDTAQNGLQMQIIHANGHKVGNPVTVEATQGRGVTDFYDVAVSDSGEIWIAASTAPLQTSDYAVAVTSVALADLEGGAAAVVDPDWYSVDARPDGRQVAPSITILNNGNAAVTWVENLGSAGLVKANILSAPETTQTGALVVNALSLSSGLFKTSVTTLENGNFVVCFDGTSGGGNQSVELQLFQPNGVKIGSPIVVPATSDISPFDGEIAALKGGGFVVVWQSASATSGLIDIRFEIFNENGVSQTTEIIANATKPGVQHQPALVALDNGGFVVSWSDTSGLRDDPTPGVFAREFDARGVPISDEFLVNTSTIGTQSNPQLAGANGKLAVLWHSFSDSAQDIVDQPFFQVVDLEVDTWGAGLPAGVAPLDFAQSLTLDNGDVLSFVTTGNVQPTTTLQHRDGAGALLKVVDLGKLDAQEMAVDAQGNVQIITSSRFSLLYNVKTYNPRSLNVEVSPIAGVEIPNFRDVFNGPVTPSASLGTIAYEGRTFGIVYATSSLYRGDIYLQELDGSGAPIGTAILLPISAVDFRGAFFDAAGVLILRSVPTPENPSGVFSITLADHNRAPETAGNIIAARGGETNLSDAVTDADGDPLSFALLETRSGVFLSAAGILSVSANVTGGPLQIAAFDPSGANVTFTVALSAAPVVRNGGNGNNRFVGDTGNDQLFGGGGNDTLEGQGGADSLRGGTGRDLLRGGSGDDTLLGEANSDTLSGNTGNDLLLAGDGADRMFGGDGRDTLAGSDGNDRAEGGDGDDLIYGNNGDDTLEGDAGQDTMSGGNNNDLLLGREGEDLIRGGNGNDRLFGGAQRDLLAGNNGRDTLFGGSHDDHLFGGGDADELDGGPGNDRLDGGSGNDFLRGGGENDTLEGDTGNDSLVGGEGADSGLGGDGNDVLYGNDGADTLNGNDGNDKVSGGNGNDILLGRNDDDTIRGGNNNDSIFGHSGDDVLAGNDGNDKISGGSGRDRVYGGAGDDRLDGGWHADVISGGSGADTFIFDAVNDSDHTTGERSVILDFVSGVDKIDLSGLQAGLSFVSAYSGSAGEVRYNGQIGRLYVDLDGDRASDFSVNLTGAPSLNESDLIL